MTEERTYELLVIGAGPAGLAAALEAAALGKKTALFEAGLVGGACLNRGCVPTKTLLKLAGEGGPDKRAEASRSRFSAAGLKERLEEVTGSLREGMEGSLKSNKVQLIRERAVLAGDGQVEAGGRRYFAEKILLACGAAPTRLPIPGLELAVTSDELLNDVALPASLVIIGGGVIGVELAFAWSAFGCQVTIIEALDRILANLDRELSQSAAQELKKRGVAIYTGARVERLEAHKEGPALSVTFGHKGNTLTLEAEMALAATGRKPAFAGLWAEGARPGTENGLIKVDAGFQTTLPGVYAVGDAIGGPQLAHKAEWEGKEAVRRMFGGGQTAGEAVEKPAASPPIPSCVYLDPELASVGLTADEAKAAGIEAVTGKYVMGANGRTVIEGGKRGFIKLVFRRGDHVLLGAQLLCYRAADLISELTLALSLGLNAEALASVVRPHPSFAEAITAAAEAALRNLRK